jgi:hypothetical protein
MLRQGFRFFRQYHCARQHHVIEAMQPFMNSPAFLEAKSKNFINLYNMGHLDHVALNQTLQTLFSTQNAPNTLEMLNKGYFKIETLVNSDEAVRKAYLNLITKNTQMPFSDFENEYNSKLDFQSIDSVISSFVRK